MINEPCWPIRFLKGHEPSLQTPAAFGLRPIPCSLSRVCRLHLNGRLFRGLASQIFFFVVVVGLLSFFMTIMTCVKLNYE